MKLLTLANMYFFVKIFPILQNIFRYKRLDIILSHKYNVKYHNFAHKSLQNVTTDDRINKVQFIRIFCRKLILLNEITFHLRINYNQCGQNRERREA